jgi:hypothetical protein
MQPPPPNAPNREEGKVTPSPLGKAFASWPGFSEYGIIDTNPQDVQAISAIFVADWNHSTAQFDDPNLVVSPINARNDFITLINSAHNTLLVEAEEMNDGDIEQAFIKAAQRGVQIEVILPTANASSGDSNSQGIATILQRGVQVREDPQLYMHAKIIVVDSRVAFVVSTVVQIRLPNLDNSRSRRPESVQHSRCSFHIPGRYRLKCCPREDADWNALSLDQR